MDIKDLAGVSTPSSKLIEVISAGVGKLYEPRAIRQRADAEAYAVKALTEAKGAALVIETEAQAIADIRRLEILANSDPDLLERARLRLLAREAEGLRNIEAIAEESFKQLPKQISDQPVTDDWRRKFFQEAENICDADLQLLWGKVLAGETASPGSYSVRTLDTLKSLSKSEAEAFRTLCGLASSLGDVVKIAGNGLKQFGVDDDVLLSLIDAGLLHESNQLCRHFHDIHETATEIVIQNNGVFFQLSGQILRHVSIPVHYLTRAGKELQNLIAPNPCEPYLTAMVASLKQMGLTVRRGQFTPLPEHPGASVLTFNDETCPPSIPANHGFHS